MQNSLRRMAPVFLVMLGALLASATLYGQVTLANSGFNSGNQPTKVGDVVGCPNGWVCYGGSPSPGTTSYAVTSNQYTAGADGLSGGLIVPSGTSAALCPTLIEGSCILLQNNFILTYMAGTTYTYNLAVGTPATMPFKANGTPDNVTPASPVGRITFYFLGNGGQVLKAVDITPPPSGQWETVSPSFTPTGGQVGQSIQIEIFADSGGNDRVVNFASPPVVVPPPVCPTPPAGTVDLVALLADPSFELGNQGVNAGDVVGCPVGWTCTPGSPTPGFTGVVPTSAQYTPVSDGVSGIVPDGHWAALAPTIIEGSGILSQTNLGTYAAGTMYTLNLWVGTPATMLLKVNGTPDNVTPAMPVGRATFYFTGTGGAALKGVDLTPPAPGQWKLVQLSFTPTGGQIGQKIGIEVFADSGGNDRAVNLDTTCFGKTTP